MIRSIYLLLFCLVSLGLYAQEGTTIFLVRHAEKEDQSRDPDLSLVGKARAHRLMELLQDANIEVIYSTDYRRTQQTVAPIAEKLAIDVLSYRPFDEEMVESLRSKYNGQNVLIAGHSNTIPDLVNQLIGTAKYEQLDDTEYSMLFVVTLISEEPSHYILRF